MKFSIYGIKPDYYDQQSSTDEVWLTQIRVLVSKYTVCLRVLCPSVDFVILNLVLLIKAHVTYGQIMSNL